MESSADVSSAGLFLCFAASRARARASDGVGLPAAWGGSFSLFRWALSFLRGGERASVSCSPAEEAPDVSSAGLFLSRPARCHGLSRRRCSCGTSLDSFGSIAPRDLRAPACPGCSSILLLVSASSIGWVLDSPLARFWSVCISHDIPGYRRVSKRRLRPVLKEPPPLATARGSPAARWERYGLEIYGGSFRGRGGRV